MTIQDMHISLNIEVDKTLDFEYPYMSPEQIDYWLNKAQDRFIKDRAYPQNPNSKGFEETQLRIEDLRTIIKESGQLTPVSSGTTYITTLPNDYQYLVRHRCITSDTTCGVKNVGGDLTRQEFINNMIKDPFWRPTADEPWYYFLGNSIVYETLGTFIVQKTNLTYIKEAAKMTLGSQYIAPTTDIDCELPEQSHQDVINIAISMILENIESQRYQTNLNELKNN